MTKSTFSSNTIETVHWLKDEGATFHGRNGTGACTGLDLFLHRGIVDLQPYTSREMLGNCNIEIPVSALPQIISTLKRIRASNLAHAQKGLHDGRLHRNNRQQRSEAHRP